MQDFKGITKISRKIISSKFINWVKNMVRVSTRKKTVAVALIIVTASITFILFSSGNDGKAVPETRRFRQYNYDVFQVLRRFGRLAKEKNIVVCVIEPHILFSMISQEQQDRLTLRTGFNFSAKNKNMVTVAVEGKTAWKLSQNTIKTDFESAGFLHFDETKQERSYLVRESKNDLSTHHFFMRHRIIVHVVIFYKRSQHFWHGKLTELPVEVAEELAQRDLFFTESDSIYNRFHVSPMAANGSYQGLYVPDNIEHFLFEIPTSQLIECRAQESRRTNDSEIVLHNFVAPTEVFVKTAESVIEEMKATMATHMAPFWLASGTLLGWYRNCGIIPHTNDMDFATWSSDLNGILAKDFRENIRLKLLSTLGQSDEDLEFWLIYNWLRVDLFFTYQDEDNFWVGGHNTGEGYSFRYLFPKFSLCSGDFLGHKVLVPCQVEEVLRAEYGSEWLTPVVAWNYEGSARNIMGRRYWTKEETFNFISQISVSH